jgi:hypothetical protein
MPKVAICDCREASSPEAALDFQRVGVRRLVQRNGHILNVSPHNGPTFTGRGRRPAFDLQGPSRPRSSAVFGYPAFCLGRNFE